MLGLSLVEAAGYGPVPPPPVRSKRFCIPVYPCELESKLSLRPEGDRGSGKEEPYVSLETEGTRAISGRLWLEGPTIPV